MRVLGAWLQFSSRQFNFFGPNIWWKSIQYDDERKGCAHKNRVFVWIAALHESRGSKLESIEMCECVQNLITLEWLVFVCTNFSHGQKLISFFSGLSDTQIVNSTAYFPKHSSIFKPKGIQSEWGKITQRPIGCLCYRRKCTCKRKTFCVQIKFSI